MPQHALVPFTILYGISFIVFFILEWTQSLHVETMCVNQGTMRHKLLEVGFVQGCHLGLT
jgi:hypothetical protein